MWQPWGTDMAVPKLNSNTRERRFGWLLLALWCAAILFYSLWDGWIWEWHAEGYDGASQHFDLDLLDLRWERSADGAMSYPSTNNLHNIVYICFAVFTMAWVGLLFGAGWARQGVMATIGFPFVATLVTLTPSDHLYPIQIVYDVVHLAGIAAGAYFFWKERPVLRRSLAGVAVTWGFFLLSRVLCEPWPYWAEARNAYFSVNNINEMPFYFFGLEYAAVAALNLAVHAGIIALRRKLPGPRARVLTPLLFYGGMCGLLKSLGFIDPPDLSGSSFG